MVQIRANQCRFSTGRRLALGGLGAAVMFACGFAWAGASAPARAGGAEEKLRVLLTQRYETLQRIVENARLQFEAGRLQVPEYQELTADLYRAEADLCPTAAERAKVYEKLVDLLTTQEKLLERQAQAGRATGIQVDQGKLVTLNARIELERLRLGQAAAQP